MKYYFLIVFLLFISSTSNSEPLILEPVFSRLSTDNGLSQDAIHSLLLDDEGFLWIGTNDGLNRFDGYQNLHVLGPNNEFFNTPISRLFQDSKKNLWVSTSTNGVYQYNLKSNTTKLILNLKQKQEEQLTQEASYITEDEMGNIQFSMDEGLYSYSYVTEKLSKEYALPDKMIMSGDYVRTHIASENTLFIGTTNGLYGVVKGSDKPILIDHVQSEVKSIDNINVKELLVDEQDTLWIGTVEGLFSMPLSQAHKFIRGTHPLPQTTLRIKNRNIWKLNDHPNGLLYTVTDKGLYSYHPDSNQQQHILLPTDSRQYISSDVLRDIIVDHNNNFWLGSEEDGVMYWSPKTTLFNNVFNTRGGRDKKIFSHNNIWSIHQQDENSLWVGTRNGLNLYDLTDGTTQSFLVSHDEKAQFSSSSITSIEAGKGDYLWLNTADGIIRFNSKTGKTSPLHLRNEEDKAILKTNVWDIMNTNEGKLLFVSQLGFFHYSPDTGEIQSIDHLSSSIIARNTVGFIEGVKPNTTLISTYGHLWEMNNDTTQLTLIHETPLEQRKSLVYPDDVLIDENNIMWITYPGYGLVGIDGTTHEEKFFYNNKNLLPSNSIFDMQKDAKGNIWLGSNSGLIRFSPHTHHVQEFNNEQGLATSEFNSDTSLTLLDGRLVYGSSKGLIFFDPLNVNAKSNDDVQVTITNVSLLSSDMNMPLIGLNGQSIELTHEDAGLSIHFSTLEFQNQKSTKYQYQLIGTNNLVYPITTRSEVMFPKLTPGNYIFSISAFNSENGVKSSPSTFNIKVNHAPWASPLAYTLYALFCLIGMLLLGYYRWFHNLRLRKAHEEAILSNDKLILALNASNSGIWEYQTEQDMFLTSKLSGEYIKNKTMNFQEHVSLIHSGDKIRYQSAWQSFLLGKSAELDITYRMRHQKNKWLWFRDVGKVIKTDTNSKPLIVTGTYTNITETVAAQENLRLFGKAFKHTLDWVIIYNHKYYPLAFNDAFKKNFNIQDDTSAATELSNLLKQQTSETSKFWNKMRTFKAGSDWKGEDKVILPNGTICDILVHVNAVANVHDKTKIEYFLVIITDITEQKTAQSKLLTLANYDSLTGLPNRSLLLNRIEKNIEHARKNSINVALFFIDLDKFKQVNDSLGHKAGDALLIIMANRLSNKLQGEDTVARLGGDEFVIIVNNVTSTDALSTLASEISDLIEQPITLGQHTVSVSSSIGVAMYPDDGLIGEELLKNADIAMYHAKEQGRSNFQFFTQEMDAQIKERLELENQLKKAHKAKIFENHYQPIFNVNTNKIEGFELLMRWPTPSGMMPPDKFIPMSEELGFIEQMTLDAFERAMPVLCTMRKNHFKGYLSVNLSAKHFNNQHSIDQIILLLEQHEIPVEAIRFEITESALMHDYDKALIYMTKIQQKGFLIALDDFGTGFSSLKYLKEFPINIIKIDKSFVDDIGTNKNNEAIILTTLSMAKQLNMSCVAEGIETVEQIAFFKKNKCQHLQGYYFSKPVPALGMSALLEKTWQL